jgi:amidohydrolase
MLVREVMKRDIITVSPKMSVREVSCLLSRHGLSALPVVAPDGAIVGMVSEWDLIHRLARPHLPPHVELLGGIIFLENPFEMGRELEKLTAVNVEEIMTRSIFTVGPDTPVDEVASLMIKKDINGIPVVEGKRLVGIITRHDLLLALSAQNGGCDISDAPPPALSNMEIMEKAGQVMPFAVEIRRAIHGNPELGMHEFQTAALICRELDKMGIPYRDKVAGTGVVGVIQGGREGRVIGLRADMDALPIPETPGRGYGSRNPGVMHACGHDAHVAMLLAAAKILSGMKEQLPGAVVLVFQPAEEGPGGALPMIKEGALKNPDVEMMLGFHVSTEEPTGMVKLMPGPVHAAQDTFKITIKGHGGHAAYPHKTVDAVLLTAQAVTSIHTIVSRRVNPVTPAVITIGTVNGGLRNNVIADSIEMTGTIRYLDTAVGKNLRMWIDEALQGVTQPVGGDYQIEYVDGYPATSNDPALFHRVRHLVRDLLGEGYVKEDSVPTMGAEDFSYFCREVPSMFMVLGVAGKNNEFSKPHHHAEFDIDENAFVNGVASYVKLCLELPLQ